MLAALYAIFVSIILLMAGWWLASLDDWFIWGMVLMGFAFLGLLKNIFAFLSMSFHTSTQINLMHENGHVSDDFVVTRLVQANDSLV